jgi:hypothetical protein
MGLGSFFAETRRFELLKGFTPYLVSSENLVVAKLLNFSNLGSLRCDCTDENDCNQGQSRSNPLEITALLKCAAVAYQIRFARIEGNSLN